MSTVSRGSRSRRFVGSLVQPEFFLDRGLGRRVAEGLTELGWIVHRAAAHFPHDAQDVEDEVWLSYGLDRGWSPLCKDGRIKGRHAEREPLELYGGVLFYLDNQRLVVADMIERFHASQAAIYRAIERGGPRAYAVGASGIRSTWP
ncbi:PIN-like domain-containing protein [Amycolatopsis speibonae]|uniref:VapC45 PIN like domain-containing protein n=1 Tax=Amycolatopsis speibonae TaxID=1450224 RepID=A0ABV7NWG6_9PSEU